jgi:DNA-binding GntR family transcriptional regulator
VLIVTRYLLVADGKPVQLATSYEPATLTAGSQIAIPEQGRLAGRGVVERLRSIGVIVDEMTEEISVRPSYRAEAMALGLPPAALVLVVERAHHASGRAVEFSEVVIPADGVRLRYRFPIAGDEP